MQSQYGSGRRYTLSTSATAPSAVSGYSGTSRLSVPVRRTPSRTFTPSPSASTTSYSRFSSGERNRYTPTFSPSSTSNFGSGASYRSSRYDSHYRKYSDDGRYASPLASSITTSRPYVTASSGVSTSRESSLSNSWPSPVRAYNLSTAYASPTAGISTRRRSPIVGGGSVPAIPSTSSVGVESRRHSSYSTDLSSPTRRRYTDRNFDAGRAETLYRPSTKYTPTNRYSTADMASGASSRRASVLSTSTGVRDYGSSISRSPVRMTSASPGPSSTITPATTAGKTLWNKHYNYLTTRWAENTGSSLNGTGKNQYSYRPSAVTTSSTEAAKSMENDPKTESKEICDDQSKKANYARRRRRRNKEESDGYDSSSSSEEEGDSRTKSEIGQKEKNEERKNSKDSLTKSVSKTSRRSAIGNSSFRRSRMGSSGDGTSNFSGRLSKEDNQQPSSSDNETVQDSLDARIKARRKRLQKSKAFLQEHKEDTWNYRRALQVEETRQRHRASSPVVPPAPEAAKITPQEKTTTENGPAKEEESNDVQVVRIRPRRRPLSTLATDSDADGKSAIKTDTTEKPLTEKPSNDQENPRDPTKQSASFDDNTSGIRVQKIYLQPLKSPTGWKKDDSKTPDSQRESVARASNSPAPNLKNSDDVMRLSAVSPSKNRGISTERTPPPVPISQRPDFNYNEYVVAITPKREHVNYETPTAALVEADKALLLQEQQKQQLQKEHLQRAVSEATKTIFVQLEKSEEDANIFVVKQKTKPLRTQPPTVVVAFEAAAPEIRDVSAVDALSKDEREKIPNSSFKKALSPNVAALKTDEIRAEKNHQHAFSTTILKEKSVERKPSSEEAATKNELRANVFNVTSIRATPERVSATVAMPAPLSSPVKISPTFTPTFHVRPLASVKNSTSTPKKSTPNSTPNPNSIPNLTPNSIAKIQVASSAENLVLQNENKDLRSLQAQNSINGSRNSLEPSADQKMLNDTRNAAIATAQAAEEKLRLALKKQKTKKALQDIPLADLHKLPSVDQEMLHLLTLGEELNASRGSLHTAGSETPSKFAQSFRTAMPPQNYVPVRQSSVVATQQYLAVLDSRHGSRESLNSFNAAPKPWRPQRYGSRESSIESLASSFATAASHNAKEDSQRDPLPFFAQQQHAKADSNLNAFPKPWLSSNVKKMSSPGFRQDNGAHSPRQMLATVEESAGEHAIPMQNSGLYRQRLQQQQQQQYHHQQPQKFGSTLDVATRKVDEMLRLAKMKHQQQQRHDKIVLSQNGNRPNFAQSDPIRDASVELDKAYEAIKRDFAEAQESRHKQRTKGEYPSQQDALFSSSKIQGAENPKMQGFTSVRMQARKMETGEFLQRQRDPNNVWKQPTNGTDTGHGPAVDQSKLDYTKRWLENDLQSLARDTKPDLLQFGSAPRLDVDQRSVGSASAEVAAITNKERLQNMRAVPDIVPQKQHTTITKEHQLVKPAPMVANAQTGMSHSKFFQYRHQQQQQPQRQNNDFQNSHACSGITFGPRVGQAGSKSSSFAGDLPSLQNAMEGGSHRRHHGGQRHYMHNPKQQNQIHQDAGQPPNYPVINFRTGGIRQAVENLRNSAESLPHSDRSWTKPQNAASAGLVRRNVDMFDRMSDNDSELSFRSADNVAYRSALNKPSKRLSLTDHMSNFTRKFESDEESLNDRQYCRKPHQELPTAQYNPGLHSDDEARLMAIRGSNVHSKRAAFGQPPPAQPQKDVGGGGGSTQSLPTAVPSMHSQQLRSSLYGPANAGVFAVAIQAPYVLRGVAGERQRHTASVSPAHSVGFISNRYLPQQRAQQQPQHLAPPLNHLQRSNLPWLNNRFQKGASNTQEPYWSSNSTLTDFEHSHHAHKSPNVKENMQAVDSLVAELELNTDASESASQRSNNFPVENRAFPPVQSSFFRHPVINGAETSSSRAKLNAIPEYNEQNQSGPKRDYFDNFQAAQAKLDEARRDLKQVAPFGVHRQSLKEKPHEFMARQDSLLADSAQRSNLEKHSPSRHSSVSKITQPLYVATNFDHYQNGHASNEERKWLPSDTEKGLHRQQQSDPPVFYRSNLKNKQMRPASYVAPGVTTRPTPMNATQTRWGRAEIQGGSMERVDRKFSLCNDQTEENNYDNIPATVWRQRQSAEPPLRKNQPSPSFVVAPPRLNSPGLIKIGSIVLGRSGTPTHADEAQNEQHSKIEKFPQQQPTRNPLRNFFQFFNKPAQQKMVNGDENHTASSQSLNVVAPSAKIDSKSTNRMADSAIFAGHHDGGSKPSDGNYFHKSSSANDAHKLRSALTAQEMRQLDELLTSFHDSDANNSPAKNASVSSKNSGQQQTTAEPAKNDDKSGSHSVLQEPQRSSTRFKFMLPSFWKRS